MENKCGNLFAQVTSRDNPMTRCENVFDFAVERLGYARLYRSSIFRYVTFQRQNIVRVHQRRKNGLTGVKRSALCETAYEERERDCSKPCNAPHDYRRVVGGDTRIRGTSAIIITLVTRIFHSKHSGGHSAAATAAGVIILLSS